MSKSYEIESSRIRWRVFAVVAFASIVIGFSGAKILANEKIGYVAGYTWFGLMLIGIPLVLGLLLAGAILNLFPRTRWFGILGIVAALLVVVSAFTSFRILDALGKVRYKHEQMVPLVPAVADLVIFFKKDASHDQVEAFWQDTLSTKQGTGHWHRPGVDSILGHLPVQGHDVLVVSFSPNATDAQRNDIKAGIVSSPIVYRLFVNIPYVEIDKMVGTEP